jgi:hypothetical protein
MLNISQILDPFENLGLDWRFQNKWRLELEGNPFERIQPQAQEVALGGLALSAGSSASSWLRDSAIREINTKLKQFEVPLSVRRLQGGKRWRAIGVALPILGRKLAEHLTQDEGDRREYDVSLGLGMNLIDDGDFDLLDTPEHGFYTGVRVERRATQGTVNQRTHQLIYDACLTPLQGTGHAEWEGRSAGHYWSIWRYCTRASGAHSAKDVAMAEYLDGLAALRGSCW